MRTEAPVQNELGDRAGINHDSLNIDLGVLRVLGDLPEEEATTWEQSILAPNREVANYLCNLIVVELSLTLPAPRLLFGIR